MNPFNLNIHALTVREIHRNLPPSALYEHAATVFGSDGLLWFGVGLCVTILPLMLIGLFALAVLKTTYGVLSGLIAGSVTDPPALAFATNITRSGSPTVAYATVYPLTMLLRILCAQVLALVSFQ